MKSIRLFTLAASALLLSGCVHPQIVSSYDALRSALQSGDRVEIAGSAGIVTGTVETVSADSIVVMSGSARREIPRAAIARLEKQERTVRRGALMGLAIGGGTGAHRGSAMQRRRLCGDSHGRTAARSSAAIGAAAGARPRATLIYVAHR